MVKRTTSETTSAEPKQIGDYRIRERLGAGGMGVVYLAEQVGPIHRQVAIKVLKGVDPAPDVVARFNAERQALSVLGHLNVASLFDAGWTNDGRPYFAMELVRGEPITEFCDRHRLRIHDRIELFLQVCDGVDHAHRRGLIHLDIKPSNLLVSETDGRATPKLIDFGIAKALDEEGGGAHLTRTSAFAGTPTHMSPERLSPEAGASDPRSDVYSLGVTLFELLVGVLPFSEESCRGAAMFGLARREPPSPSRRFGETPATQETLAGLRSTDVGELRSQLTRNLDAVVSKALAPKAEDRYRTARALADDLRRFLDGEPTTAGNEELFDEASPISGDLAEIEEASKRA